jgi:hypothetical protein
MTDQTRRHWDGFAIITALLLFNAALELWQDSKASAALAVLTKGLARKSHRQEKPGVTPAPK